MKALLAAAVGSLGLAATAFGAAPPSAPPLAAFAGFTSQQSNVNPADVQLAVGPTAIVQAVNSSIGVWSTAGQQLRSQTLGAFFSGGGVDRSADATTDPRVLWDPVSGRFFASMFDISRLEIVLAVSGTTDPLGAWAIYPQPSTGCTDQPRLGTSDNVVVITDDLFSSCTGFGRFLGGEVVVLNKQDLLAGAPTPRRARFGPDPRFAAVTPAQSLGPTAVEYLVAVSDSAQSLQLFNVPDASITALPFKVIPVASLPEPDEVPQRASFNAVDAGDNRVQNVIFDAGRVWATMTVGCGQSVDCARVAELDPARARLVHESTVALPAGRALIYPAATPDSRGNIVLAYSFTSPNDFPGFGYTYVRPDGVAGTPFDLILGSAPQNSGRFGDYSGAARDPADPSRIWVSAEIGQALSGSPLDWGSGIASVQVPAQSPAIVSTAASGTRVTAAIYAEALPTSVRLEFGPTKSYGSQTAAVSVPPTAREQPVSFAPAGLAPGIAYHGRLVATSSAGTSTGPDVVLRTPAAAPRVTYPAPAASRAASAVVLRARVTADGAPTSVVFEYGPTRAYGSRVAAGRVPGTAVGQPVTARVRLVAGRTYHFRVVATNAKGKRVAPDRVVRA